MEATDSDPEGSPSLDPLEPAAATDPGGDQLAPPTGGASRTKLWIAVGAVAAVVIVLLASILGHLGPFAGSPSGRSDLGSPLTFDGAVSEANARVASLGSGPWSLFVAEGFVPTSDTRMSTNFSAPAGRGGACPFQSAPGVPDATTMRAVGGNLSTGTSFAWLINMLNSTGSELVLVQGSSVTWLGGANGPGCRSVAQAPSLPSAHVDSPAAVRTAMDSGGYAFLDTHPTSKNVTMTLVPSVDYLNHETWLWTLVLEGCFPNFPPTGAPFYYSANVDAISGMLSGSPQTTSLTC